MILKIVLQNAKSTVILIQLFLISMKHDIFVASEFGREIISLCGGSVHTCFVFDDKRMKCTGLREAWGAAKGLNNNDKYGDELAELGANLPYVDVGTSAGVEKASCGSYHICIKLDSGDMKCMGSNVSGRLGLEIPPSQTPIGQVSNHIGDSLPVVNLGGGFKVIDIVLGASHSCALSTGGFVKCFGYNEYGQLGQMDKKDRGTSLSQMGDNLQVINLGTNVKVASIHSGPIAFHNCAILSEPANHAQKMKCWGLNSYSQLGDGTNNFLGDGLNQATKQYEYDMGDNLPFVNLGTELRVKTVALGYTHTCALVVNDLLRCFGVGGNGRLGWGSVDNIQATGNALPNIPYDSNKRINYIGAGRQHTCIMYDDSTTMKCVGLNDAGQLGQNDTLSRGDHPTRVFNLIPAIEFGTGSLPITLIMVAEHHNCVKFIDSTVKCFGYNGQGQLGLGNINNYADGANEMGYNLPQPSLLPPSGSPTPSPTLPTKYPTYQPYTKIASRPIKTMDTGDAHMCVLFEDGKVKCSGRKSSFGFSNNDDVALGATANEIGDSIPYLDISNSFATTDLKCGGFHVCFALESKRIKCVGNNKYGQLGLGLNIDYIGAISGHVGDQLPFVDLGDWMEVISFSVGLYHTCVQVTGNKVKCFGNNWYGNLGYGDGNDRGRSLEQMGGNLAFVDLAPYVQVSSIYSGSSAQHNCAILSAPLEFYQRVKCWGFSQTYQTGYGTLFGDAAGNRPNQMGDYLPLVDLGTESKVKQLSLGGRHTCAILFNDGLKCWGDNQQAQLGIGPVIRMGLKGNSLPFVLTDPGKTVKRLSAGLAFTCILYDDALTYKCVGDNYQGELGQGDIINRGTNGPTLIPYFPAIDLGTGDLQIKSIESGGEFNCVLFIDSSIKCFGRNEFGQFLIGSKSQPGDPATVMGNKLQFSQLISPTQSPSKGPTYLPTTLSPTKNPTRKPTTSIPTISPTFKATNSTSATNESPQTSQIIIGVSVSVVFGVAAVSLVLLFRYRNRIKVSKLKDQQNPSSPSSAVSIRKL